LWTSLPTMVNTTNAIFFATATVASDVETMVMFPNAMVPIMDAIVFATNGISLIIKTILPVNEKMVSGFFTMGFFPHSTASDTFTMVFVFPTMVSDVEKIFSGIKTIGDRGRSSECH
jgi:hypothetical protein